MSCTSPISLEPLESRQLLAGVTVLIHGHQGSITGWVGAAADAIADRAGGASQYILKVGKSSGDVVVTSFKLDEGPALKDSSNGEVIIKLDWTDIDDGSVSTEKVGQVVGTYLLSSHGSIPALAALPVHLIGHSRGASLAVSITKRLGQAGVWVDQDTFLDPHPVEGLFGYGDTSMRVYSNVIFADNYWRDDGNVFNFDPDGQPVSGTHQVNLKNSVQQNHIISAHVAVTSYYHGTIDLHAVFNNDHPVFDSWYDDSPDKPPRDKTGYYFSRIVGGTRPADGLIAAFGGNAKRNNIAPSGTQWANTGGLSIGNGSTIKIGQDLKLKFIRQNRDSHCKLTIYFDRDQNPFNDNHYSALRKTTVDQSNEMKTTNLTAPTNKAKTGDVYLVIRSTDSSGRTRYTYSDKVHVTA